MFQILLPVRTLFVVELTKIQIQGQKVGCFGLTEPNHGSNPNGMETIAKYDKATDTYILNGSKTWITNSPIADTLVVWARSEAHNMRIKGFILERQWEGIDTPTIPVSTSISNYQS